jgi:two-component system OmpR family sensor kinase
MGRRFRTLCFRLTLLYTVVFGVVFAGLGVVGWRLAGPNESRRALGSILLLAIPGGLLAAGLAAWRGAKRSLAPIGRITQEVERLGAEDLCRRLDSPGGGDEAAELVKSMNQLLDRLEVAFTAQERFLAGVSHELKTPLSVLLGEAQVLMQRERTAEEIERFVASVQDEVRSLAQTVDSVLVLARAEAGLRTPFAGEVPLNDVVMDAVQRCQPLAKQQEVRLVPHLALPQGDEPPPYVRGDGELLRLLFVNLLRNAIHFSPADEAVDIAVAVQGEGASVRVRDRGPGIPPEHLHRVFERFFCVPRAEGTFRGAGLGLTIVRGVARLHGGTVAVCNHPQGGCEFVTHLPLLRRE